MGLLDRVRQMRTDIGSIAVLLPAAERAALADGRDLPDVEHLVLGALELPEDSAATALRAVGIDPEALPGAVRRAHNAVLGAADDDGPVEVPDVARGAFRATPTAQAVFRRVHDLVVEGGQGLRGAHVVLAAGEVAHGTWPRTLQLLGVERDALADAARDVLAG